MKKKLYFIILIICICLVCLRSCMFHYEVKGRYVTLDRAYVYTFDEDSVYIDTIGTENGRKSFCLKDRIYDRKGEILYILYTPNSEDSITLIRLFPDPFGNHWSYFMQINGKKTIYVDKIN